MRKDSITSWYYRSYSCTAASLLMPLCAPRCNEWFGSYDLLGHKEAATSQRKQAVIPR
jgi:hypothetical protein